MTSACKVWPSAPAAYRTGSFLNFVNLVKMERARSGLLNSSAAQRRRLAITCHSYVNVDLCGRQISVTGKASRIFPTVPGRFREGCADERSLRLSRAPQVCTTPRFELRQRVRWSVAA